MPNPNPYRDRIGEFPGRILPPEDCSADGRLHAILALSPSEIFIEIGSGSGGHLLQCARQSPQGAFFGFELRYKRAVRTIEKALAWGIENVYVLRCDARELGALFSPRSLHGCWVNFPDPWPKRRGAKHRVLGETFLHELAVCLRPGAFLSLKTDHRDYFDTVVALLERSGDWETEFITQDLYHSAHVAQNIESEFEKLFRSKNQPICQAVVRRTLKAEESLPRARRP